MKDNLRQFVKPLYLVTAMSALILGCAKANFSSKTNDDGGAGGPGASACDPWSPPGGPNSGLKGDIFYLKPEYINSNVRNHVDNYYNTQYANKTPETLYLNQLNVPTHLFNSGFPKPNSETVKDSSGQTLIEWFALRLKSKLKLAPGDNPGQYQLGILSDDGSIISIGGQDVINNDLVTPTRFAYASQPISMTNDSRLDLKVKYFQGPRYHIALILMWRPWTGNPYDPLGGQYGNLLYFDYRNTPSTPQPAYNELLSRAWRPLRPENFELPNNEVNPCYY